MSTSSIKGVSKEEILATFAEAINNKYVKGDQGDLGLDGRSPIHVQETKPAESVSEEGDLWYRPSSKKMFLYDGSAWEEVLKQGEIGLEGDVGPRGPKGDKGDTGAPGKAGKDGKDGKDAVIDYQKVEKTAAFPLKEHERKYDHSLIDPFLIGTKKIDEEGIGDEKVLKFNKKLNRIVYGDVKSVTNVVHQGGGGTTLPSQSGNSGKYLKTNGTSLSWSADLGTGDVTGPSSAVADNVVIFNGTTGKIIKDSGLALSGTNTGDQLVFKTIAVAGQSNVVADSATDTLTLVAGTNVTITTDASTDTITIAASGASGITRSVNSIAAPTTAGATAQTDYVYFVSGTTTLTLPTAVGNTNRYTVKNVGANTVTIATTGGQTIDGSSTASLPVANTSLDLISDNSNWKVV